MEAKVKSPSKPKMDDTYIKPISDWSVYKQRPLVISGPCSAETEEQVMETARILAATGRCDVFRAGVWKPRTKPGGFEGVGSVALKWMKRVSLEYGLPVAVEVANQKHVYEALKYGIDILWIGARTTTNPFSIQEIADTLKGVDVTVLVKNPVNPDLNLWIGAIERINKVGINRIGAIHRGFSCYENELYRNTPKWQIPVELRRRMPGVPVITDPSHMSGRLDYLGEISQKAMDLNFDGLMIESHIDPEKAWSDSKQQIHPGSLVSLLDELEIKRNAPASLGFSDTIEELRDQIDIFDDQLMEILGQRFKLAGQIGSKKKKLKMKPLQNDRKEQVIARAVERGKEKGLGAEFVREIFEIIHRESLNRQIRKMRSE